MLAGAGLSDDATLAHALGQQSLTQSVVELVRAGVVEILTLEVHGSPGSLGEAMSSIERSRPTREVAQQAIQLSPIRRVLACLRPRQLKLGQGRHQSLG